VIAAGGIEERADGREAMHDGRRDRSGGSEPRGPSSRGSASGEPRSSRRDFLRTTARAGAALSAAAALGPFGARLPVHAAGSDALRVGLIGCGGRGTGAAVNCVRAAEGVTLVAMADLFPDRLAQSRETLREELGDRFAVDDEHAYTGFDAYIDLLVRRDTDLVILATPPVFRPIHFAAAVQANQHVFLEKPVAVDPVGVRAVIAATEEAGRRKLAVVAGTQRRHQASYLETMKRIQDGAIGDLLAGECHWNQGGLWVHERKEGESEMEWQLRNWLYFSWTSGDHIVEQHVHNLDVMNWALGGPPASAIALGGRQVRTEAKYGNVFDHFAVEYEYLGGIRVASQCRQIDGCASRVGERLVGTDGIADPSGTIWGRSANWRFKGEPMDPYQQEHADLIASIRKGEPLSEGRTVAESTLTAIIGRMSAYTGQKVTWEHALASTLDLTPKEWRLGDHPVDAVAVPGRTPLV